MATKCPKCHAANPETAGFCAECGTRLRLQEDIPVLVTKTLISPAAKGRILAGKYRIIEPIGKGGMGVVYKAKDIRLERDVALKFLPAELADNPEARERFIREAKAAAALSHPHICIVHEINEEEQEPFIVMEYVEGQSLKEKLRKGTLDQAEALDIAIQVAEGLEEAHQKGIIHRDIKPGNIMLKDRGTAKVMDFGLAKVFGASLITKEAKTMGTAAYMSPEQAQGQSVDPRTDIWSLGVVLYEMLAGDLPFRGETEVSFLYSVVHEDPLPLKGQKPSVPLELQQIIDRALKKQPEARFRSAAEMLENLRKYTDAQSATTASVFGFRYIFRRMRQPRLAVPMVIALVAVFLLAIWFFRRQGNTRWARNTALPKIKQLIDSGEMNYGEAYALALKAERYIPKDPSLLECFSRCGKRISVQTEPPGAKVFMNEYSSPEKDWSFLGVSPLENAQVPFGFFRWKFEKYGYEPAVAVYSTFEWEIENPLLMGPAKIFKRLDKKGSLPPGMVLVSAGNQTDFFMDEHEVTNREFKEFVDQGGYQKKEYWEYSFEKNGKTVAWEEAMAGFLDETGIPGPSTWEGGNYSDGQDDFPVSGVSWYEAAAFAEFSGKRLPTVKQWELGAGLHIPTVVTSGLFLPLVASMSNFNGEKPAPVKAYPGITTNGAYDMAGNVREWCLDEAEKGRCLRGGAWNDVTYMFLTVSQAPPSDRSAKNGFRCVRPLSADETTEASFQAYKYQEMRDFYKEKPVPDEIFKVYREQFFYDRIELDPRPEAKDESRNDWTEEKVSFATAYDNERMAAYLFLPKKAAPPFQTVIVCPGSQRVFLSSSEKFEESAYFELFNFIIRTGRALVYPIYKGSYERGNPAVFAALDLGNGTRQYSEYVIKLVKDFKRTVDYLETRADIDIDKLAFYGHSTGAIFGAIIPAVEERIRVSVLNAGGLPNRNLSPEKARPEVDAINYVTRVKIPTLMLNGFYDYHAFPYETSARPMFELLGTSQPDKMQKTYDSDHVLPKSEYIRDTLNWLDRYLGPVKRKD